MKISKQYLKQIIKEEYEQVMNDSNCGTREEEYLEEADEYVASAGEVRTMKTVLAATFLAAALAAGYGLMMSPSDAEVVQRLSDKITRQYPEVTSKTVNQDGYDGAGLMKSAIDYAVQKAGGDKAFISLRKEQRAALIEEYLEMKRRERSNDSLQKMDKYMQQRNKVRDSENEIYKQNLTRPYKGL